MTPSRAVPSGDPDSLKELPGRGDLLSHWHWACIDEMQMVFQALRLEAELIQLEGGSPFTGRLLILEVPPLRLMRFDLHKRLHTIGSKPKGMLSVNIDLAPRPFEVPWKSHGQILPVNSLFGLRVNRAC